MTEDELELLLSAPSRQVGLALAVESSPLLILGASGKMGPTLSLLAKRSLQIVGSEREIIAVARFSTPESREWFDRHQIKTIACDLLEQTQLEMLPDATQIVYLVGRKFGTSDTPSLTWALNILPPTYVCERYPESTIVALSTGSIYPLVPVNSGGSVEEDALTPIGEYANACIARERVFEYFSSQNKTQICLLRLNYAVEPRYGVLVDIAVKVLNREPIDLTMGYLNCIWGRDANDMTLRSFDLATTPASPFNITGPAIHSVRDIASTFGRHFNREPIFTGVESDRALLNNPTKALKILGEPEMNIEAILSRTADWIRSNGRLLGKPTHYEVRDGQY